MILFETATTYFLKFQGRTHKFDTELERNLYRLKLEKSFLMVD